MRLLQFGCCFLTFSLLLFLYFSDGTAAAAASSMLDAAAQDEDAAIAAGGGLKGRLVFAHVIYRHGDRLPIDPYPTDPWKKSNFWPTGWGQLTNLGKVQQYHLGQWLRQRYDSLLSRTYSSNEIYIRSTDVDRTLMSALSNLAGLYPPVNDQVWNTDIAWQPIPIHTVPEKTDHIAGKATCVAYDHALAAVLNSPEIQAMNERYTYLFDYLTKFTGRTVNSMEGIQRINNTLYIESLYNKTLPEWTKKVFPSTDMSYISDFFFTLATYTRKMARLKAGPMIKEILERFNDKQQQKLLPDRNVWVYSAHDTTVANVLNALKLFDMHSPDYTSCILIEMRLIDKQQPYISIFYKANGSVTDPLPLNIPDCGIACPLKRMFTLYRDIIPVDWSEECKLSTLLMTYEDANISLAMGILVAIISVMLFLSYMIMIFYRRRSYRNHFAYSQVA